MQTTLALAPSRRFEELDLVVELCRGGLDLSPLLSMQSFERARTEHAKFSTRLKTGPMSMLVSYSTAAMPLLVQ